MVKISVIVPIYHGKKYISGLIKQVEACARFVDADTEVELLLINDAPDDFIEENYCSQNITILVDNTERNRGIHGARVHGLSLCTGQYVVFLDQDDKIAERYLKSQLENIGDAVAVVCRALHDNKLFYNATFPFEKVTCKKHMIEIGNGIVSPGQVLVKKEAIPNVWKENILTNNGVDDWFLWICMLSRNDKFALNEEVLFEHIIHGQNVSGKTIGIVNSGQEVFEYVKKNKVLQGKELEQMENAIQQSIIQHIQMMDKYKDMFMLYDKWLRNNRQERKVAQYLNTQGCKTVAIYGNGYLGRQLYEELSQDGIIVRYYIDQNALYIKEEIPIYAPEQILPQVDAVVIALVQSEKEIIENLRKKMCAKYYTIKELIYGM